MGWQAPAASRAGSGATVISRRSDNAPSRMMPRMTVAELEAFLRAELPYMFRHGSFAVEHADGQTCRIRQGFHESMLRPGGTISGPTLMALADCAMYVVLLSAIGPVALAVT